MANPLYDALFGRHEGAETPFLHLADGTTLTHGAFLRLAARQAHALRAAGLAPGDRLAVQAAKSPAMLATYAACVRAGVRAGQAPRGPARSWAGARCAPSWRPRAWQRPS